MSHSPYSVFSIADEILRIAKRRGQTLTPLKLMKLTYIAFGWFIANRDMPLFNEKIEAWKYGPVIPDLYHATKKYGRDPIPEDLIKGDGIATDEGMRSFLEEIFDKYGDQSGIFLSNLTHKPGTPWYQVYEPDVLGREVTVESIKSYYRQMLTHD